MGVGLELALLVPVLLVKFLDRPGLADDNKGRNEGVDKEPVGKIRL